jgi:hypothetical protein
VIVSQSSPSGDQRPRWGLAIFCLTQLLLTYGALGWLAEHWFQSSSLARISLIVGVGDAQLALSGLLLGWRIFRWSVRWPLALVLLFSGSAIHFVSIIDWSYPFVSGEEYLIAPFQVVALSVALRRWSVRSGESAIWPESNLALAQRLQLSDLFGWILAAGLCLAIGKRAILLTDVSGMADPWDTFDLMIRHNPAMVLWRVPLLFAVVATFVIAWILASHAILVGPRLTFRQLLRALVVVGCLFVTEVVFGFVPLLFDPPWPIVPVSIDLSFLFAGPLSEFWSSDSTFVMERGLNLVGLFTAQLVTFSGSLLLLRWSGVRVVPAVATSARLTGGGS